MDLNNYVEKLKKTLVETGLGKLEAEKDWEDDKYDYFIHIEIGEKKTSPPTIPLNFPSDDFIQNPPM